MRARAFSIGYAHPIEDHDLDQFHLSTELCSPTVYAAVELSRERFDVGRRGFIFARKGVLVDLLRDELRAVGAGRGTNSTKDFGKIKKI